MHEPDDSVLLRDYVERGSEDAFAALVARHVNKVYSVALRHTANPYSAEEITQAVFVILARKSHGLSKRVVLSGWLYETARLTAATFIRSEIRRAHREQEAHMQNVSNENEAEVWQQIAPLLDAAMAGLNETDRHAVVLRFFDGRSMSEVGTALGAAAVQTLHAQAKPPAFQIVEVAVNDQDGFSKEFVPLISKVQQDVGGKFQMGGVRTPVGKGGKHGGMIHIGGTALYAALWSK